MVKILFKYANENNILLDIDHTKILQTIKNNNIDYLRLLLDYAQKKQYYIRYK